MLFQSDEHSIPLANVMYVRTLGREVHVNMSGASVVLKGDVAIRFTKEWRTFNGITTISSSSKQDSLTIEEIKSLYRQGYNYYKIGESSLGLNEVEQLVYDYGYSKSVVDLQLKTPIRP